LSQHEEKAKQKKLDITKGVIFYEKRLGLRIKNKGKIQQFTNQINSK